MNGLAVIADLSSKFPFLPKKPSESGPGKFRRFGPWRASVRQCRPRSASGLVRFARIAAGDEEIGNSQGAAFALQGFFRRGRRRRRRGRGAHSPRYLPLRQCLRPSSGDRSRGAESFWQGQAKGRRRLQAYCARTSPRPISASTAHRNSISDRCWRGIPNSRFLELGRSCVLADYRGKKTIEMLWRGIWSYVKHHRIDAMIGCASLEGTDQEKLAPQLSFLFHHAKAAPEWLVSPLPQRFAPMNRLRKEQVEAKRALAALPPARQGLHARSAPDSARARLSTGSSGSPTSSSSCRSARSRGATSNISAVPKISRAAPPRRRAPLGRRRKAR